MRFPPLDKAPAEYTPDEVECLIVDYKRQVELSCLRRSMIEKRAKQISDAHDRCGRTQRALGKAVEEAQRLREILEKIDRVTATCVRNDYLVGLVESIESLLSEVDG